jgi:tetratricopeptide (TPR) repeat protein
MFTFLKRPFYVLSNKIRRKNSPEALLKEKWLADFSDPARSCFDIKPEIAYDAYLEKGALALALKKKNCFAWLETADRYYEDQVIEARFRLDSPGEYAAAGILFRIIEPGVHYTALISGKGYFRLEVMRDGIPRPLIGWIEAPGLNEHGNNLTIIARGGDMIFLINGRWIAEASDDSIPGGRIGFALAAYDSDDGDKPAPDAPDAAVPDSATVRCRAWLDFLSLDSRNSRVERCYKKWKNSPDISVESRLRLADAFAALDTAEPALTQITKAWERREEAARGVTAAYTETRTRRELLLAARMAERLEHYLDAEEYINACLAPDAESPEAEEAYIEKAKILSILQKHAELKSFLDGYIARRPDDPALYALLGHAHWSLGEFAQAALAWDRAFALDGKNGLYAVNAANAYGQLGKKDEALRRRLEGGRVFLRQDNYGELGALIPKLISTGVEDWEARALAGKWAFGIEDYDRAESELARSDSLRCRLRPVPPADPAVSYLRGQLLIRRNRPREAIVFLEEAVSLAPDYDLFRQKLAETRRGLTGGRLQTRA